MGAAASLGAGFAGGAGGGGGGGGLPSGAGITMAVPPAMQHGGEVPIMAHRGEFVVNARAAQANKGILEEINSGDMNRVRGTQNVFLIRANDAQSFANMLSTPSARHQIEIAVIRAVTLNQTIRPVLKEFVK